MNVDLEHFPTSPSAQRMMSRISPVYDNSYVGKWLFQVMGLEMDDLRVRLDELSLQIFPETATWAIHLWENRYNITPNPKDSLETRRQALIVRRSIRSPMSPARVEEILHNLTGKTVDCVENVEPYTFSVVIHDLSDNDVNIKSVYECLWCIKPSHQSFVMKACHRKQAIQLFVGTAQPMLYSRTVLPNLECDRSMMTKISLGTGIGNYLYSKQSLPAIS